MIMNIHNATAILSFPVALLSSCSSSALKAPAAKLSPFLSQLPTLKADRELSPFALSGGSPLTTQPDIYIAPVTLKFLRETSKSLAKNKNGDDWRQQAARELAEYTRQQFIDAFQKSPLPRYVVRDKPGRNCIKLELALTELNRNTFTGAFTRFAMNAIALPGTDALLAKPARGLKGNIAIEGKVTNLRTGAVVYQFADNEESKSALLLPVTDFAAYGQARDAIRDWAKEFEQITRAPPGKRVKSSSVISLF